ncbi:MAG: hypothetical protein ACI82H_001183 [Alphaproteobacteria bacterium]|jgi:hypothetical protein
MQRGGGMSIKNDNSKEEIPLDDQLEKLLHEARAFWVKL